MPTHSSPEEWLAEGLTAGWISNPFCTAHDMPPLTEAEAADLKAGPEGSEEDILDRCMPAVRLYDQPLLTLDPSSWMKAGVRVVTECGDALLDNATSFTCDEADAMAGFLTVYGGELAAAAFLEAHAEGDDPAEGDRHAPTPLPFP